MVTMFISAFCAVSLRRSVAPVSLNRLPSIRQPIRGAVSGSSSATKITTTMGKMIFSALDTVRGLHHLDLAIFGGGQQVHDGGLDQRDQRHVGVSSHGDGAQQFGGQTGGQEDGGGAVRAADDADGSGLGAGKAQQHAAQEGNEHAQLCGSAQQQALGIG